LDTLSSTPPLDEWVKVLVHWKTDGTISVTIFNADGTEFGSLTGTSSTFTSGGIGFSANYHGAGTGSGIDEEVYWDDVLII